MNLANVTKVISEGTGGAELAARTFAMGNGFEHRTIGESDGTVVFTTDPPGLRSASAIKQCLGQNKPYLVLTQEVTIMAAAFQLLGFIRRNGIKTLQVVGNRQSEHYHWAMLVLKRAAAEAEDRGWQDRLSTAPAPNGEDPKRFLKVVRSGIGESQNSPGAEWIDFKDDQNLGCKVQCHNAERLYIIPEAGRLALSQGQAKRLAHTLERWATAGDLGKGVGAIDHGA